MTLTLRGGVSFNSMIVTCCLLSSTMSLPDSRKGVTSKGESTPSENESCRHKYKSRL